METSNSEGQLRFHGHGLLGRVHGLSLSYGFLFVSSQCPIGPLGCVSNKKGFKEAILGITIRFLRVDTKGRP